VDTPGLHRAHHKLGVFLNQEALAALEGVDVVLCMFDLSQDPEEADVQLGLEASSIPRTTSSVVVGNKIDQVDPATAAARMVKYADLVPDNRAAVMISATRGDGVEALISLLAGECPERPAEFEEEQITDLYERDIAADLIREAALGLLRDEVPHALAVRLDDFKERPNGTAYVVATLLVERDSQKGIVIGESGKMLKQIGIRARASIEDMRGHPIYLELRVKVEKGWRNDEGALDRLGYKLKR
jgi:GTP-binding protein Era